MNLNTITHIYAFGPPGAGKTTQMEGIFGVGSGKIIDTGAIIRGAVTGKGEFGTIIRFFNLI